MENSKKLIWNQELVSGNAEIDCHRKKLIGIYNNMLTCVSEYPDFKLFEKLLMEFTITVIKLFKTEEELVSNDDIVFLNAHKVLHSSFIYQLDIYNIEMVTSSTVNPYLVINYIDVWWKEHIMIEDNKHKSIFQVRRKLNKQKTEAFNFY